MSEMQDKVEGKAKEIGGAVTGNDRMEAEGKAQGLKGNVEGKANELKDKAQGAVDGATTNNDNQ